MRAGVGVCQLPHNADCTHKDRVLGTLAHRINSLKSNHVVTCSRKRWLHWSVLTTG